MFSEILLCIFTYNRPRLLQNLLASAIQFYPEMPVALFDDDSTDPQLLEMFQTIRKKEISVHINKQSTNKRKHGGLYKNMNAALQYAKERDYKYAYFVQDDMQFLWRDKDLGLRLQQLFARDECVMCNFNFLQKILRDGLQNRLIKQDNSLIYSFAEHGVADTGIIDLEKARQVSLCFTENSERENGKLWHQKGYHLYWLPQPHLAWIPFPTSFRYKNEQRHHVHSLRSLSDKSIEKISSNKDYAFLEDYTSAPSLFLKPYWFTVSPGKWNLTKIYLQYYLRELLR